MNEPIERPALFTRAFVLVWLANLALNVAAAFALHLPGFLAQLGAREAEIGRVLAVHALTAALLGPLAGRIMDVRGRRVVIRGGAVLALIASLGYVAIRSLGPLLYAVRVLDGAGATFLYASLFTYAAELVPPAQRTQGIALFGVSGLAPFAISSLLGDTILAFAGYRTLFLTAVGFCALGAVLCFSLPQSARPRAPHERSSGAPPARAAGSLLWRTATNRRLLPVWSAALAFFGCMAGLLAFMKTFVVRTGYGSVGEFFGTYAAVALVLRIALGGVPDRVGLRRMLLPAIGSYALGIVAVALAHDAGGLLLAGALCGVGHGYSFPVLLSLVVERAEPATRGTATGVYTAVDWTGNLLAPPLLGGLIERAGYPSAFLTLGAFGLAGVLGFYLLDRDPRLAADRVRSDAR